MDEHLRLRKQGWLGNWGCLSISCTRFHKAGGWARTWSQGFQAEQLDPGAWCTIQVTDCLAGRAGPGSRGQATQSAWLCAGLSISRG